MDPLDYGKRRIYRVASPLQVMVPAIITMIVAFVVVVIVTEPKERVILPYMTGLLLLVLGIVYWVVQLARLEVSSDGITYHAVGYKVHSTWSNIQGYGKRAMGANDVECLILRTPGLQMSWWLRIGQALQPVGQVAGALQGQYVPGLHMDDYAVWIPVSLYALNWRASKLGDTIKHYAPEAFDTPL